MEDKDAVGTNVKLSIVTNISKLILKLTGILKNFEYEIRVASTLSRKGRLTIHPRKRGCIPLYFQSLPPMTCKSIPLSQQINSTFIFQILTSSVSRATDPCSTVVHMDPFSTNV